MYNLHGQLNPNFTIEFITLALIIEVIGFLKKFQLITL